MLTAYSGQTSYNNTAVLLSLKRRRACRLIARKDDSTQLNNDKLQGGEDDVAVFFSQPGSSCPGLSYNRAFCLQSLQMDAIDNNLQYSHLLHL